MVLSNNNNEPVYFTTKSYIAYREMICLYIKAIICVHFVQYISYTKYKYIFYRHNTFRMLLLANKMMLLRDNHIVVF